MTAATTGSADRFEEMSDNDIETLIRGGVPTETELIPLTAILAEFRSLADWTGSESFVDLQVAAAAELAAARHANASVPRLADRRRRLVDGARRRTATAAAALAMFASATGVALASDDAVPGDWDYGLDRALEMVGIGVGGESERLLELQVLDGLDVAGAGSNVRPAWVTGLLHYLKDTESVDGSSVSEIAGNGAGRPEDPGAAGRANKPEDPGAAGKANKPEDPGAAGRANKPEDPAAAGGAGQPEDPGAAGRANEPEDPGAAGGVDQLEDSGGAGLANKPEDPGGANNPKKASTP